MHHTLVIFLGREAGSSSSESVSSYKGAVCRIPDGTGKNKILRPATCQSYLFQALNRFDATGGYGALKQFLTENGTARDKTRCI